MNIVAGLVIGVLQHGLDLSTAAQTFTILTVGEGLVTAIPALLVSMSGGLITTRAASESHLGEEVAGQLLARTRPLAVAAGVLIALALVPGLPKFAFLVVAAIMGAAAYANRERRRRGSGGCRAADAAARRSRWRRAPSSRSASRSATRWCRWSTRSRAERSCRASDRSAARSRPRPAWSCRRSTSPTTCSSGRGPTRSC